MKILQVSNRFYPYIGGTENYVYNLSKELVRMGHKVTVICAREPGIDSGIVDGIEVIRTKYIFKIANTNITPLLPLEILKQDFDVIHSYVPHPWSVDWAALFAFILRKPLVITYNNDIPEKGKYRILTWVYNRIFLKFVLFISKGIITTQKSYIDFSKVLKKYKKKIRVIPCGVDLDKFFPIETEKAITKKVFFLSILDEYHRYKGLDYLLKAFTKVVDEQKDVLLIVGGDGVLRQEYENMAKDLGISRYVNFVGRIPEEELNRYFNECDVFVLPSISSDQEGFGIVALEAMACAKPLIVTNIIGAAEDIAKYQAGYVVKIRDAQDLADCIKKILRSHDQRAVMSQKAIKLVKEKYSWDSISREIEVLYGGLIK